MGFGGDSGVEAAPPIPISRVLPPNYITADSSSAQYTAIPTALPVSISDVKSESPELCAPPRVAPYVRLAPVWRWNGGSEAKTISRS